MRNLRTEKEIMARWQGDPAHPLVSICCIAYNHEPYIADALEGFLIQETNFPFEILIHDDASTDRTADIIREYEALFPALIKPIYQAENQYSKGNKPGLTNRQRAKGKYIALCEGDDFWIDPSKIQKQADFLEENPNYGLIHSDASVLFHEEGRSVHRINTKSKPPTGDIFQKLLIKNSILTLTTMFNTSIAQKAYSNMTPVDSWKMGDYPLWLEISLLTEIKYMDDVTSVRRIIRDSASANFDAYKRKEFMKSYRDISLHYCYKYMKDHEYYTELINQRYYRFLIYHAFRYKDKSIVEEDTIRKFLPKTFFDYLLISSLKYHFFNFIALILPKIRRIPLIRILNVK